jgi:hypothetical protein
MTVAKIDGNHPPEYAPDVTLFYYPGDPKATDRFRMEMLADINEFRATLGLPPLPPPPRTYYRRRSWRNLFGLLP